MKQIENEKNSLNKTHKSSYTHEKRTKTFVKLINIYISQDGNVFEKRGPWLPTHVYNRYFERFKKLNQKYEMDNWENVNKNLIFS